MACNLFLTNILEADVRRASKRFCKNNNVEVFIKTFIKDISEIPEKARYTISNLDSKDDIQSSILNFHNIFSTVKAELENSKPELKAALDTLLNAVYSSLHIALDLSLSGAILNTFIEVKSEKELRDIHLRALDEHMIDIYGPEAHDIRTSILQNFNNDIISAAYRDKISGELILRDGLILNKNIHKLKNKYYRHIILFLQLVQPSKYVNSDVILSYLKKTNPKKYELLTSLKKENPKQYKENLDHLMEDCLKDLDGTRFKILKTSVFNENDKFIGAEYYNNLLEFYKYILKLKSLGLFNNELTENWKQEVLRTNLFDKNNIYTTILSALKEQSTEFKDKLYNIYKSKKRQSAINLLYIANNYSPYYITVKQLINDLNLGNITIGELTINLLIESIEEEDINLLKATEAYTCLTHFDSLLRATQGESIVVKDGLENIESNDIDKYQHHTDTSTQRKSWQSAEAIDSEKYIANISKNILNLVDIFSYRTDTYQNRRADTTSFINAARNLMNDFLFGNIKIKGIGSDSDRKTKTHLTFLNYFITFHNNPTRNFLKILEYLFDTVNGNHEELYLKISNNKILTDYDLDILYSVYHTIFNKNNPSSLINKELSKQQSSSGIISHLVNEFSGMVDRNVNVDYLETDFDYADNVAYIKMKRKFYNNLQVIKTIKDINTSVNKKTSKEAQDLLKRYNFNIIESIDGNDIYSIDLGLDKILLYIPSSSTTKILSNVKGLKFDPEVFDKVEKVDLIAFREKLLDGGSYTNLTDNNEKLLYNMLKFIEDFLGIKTISDPSLGLQILLVYKSIYNPKDSKYNKNEISIQGKSYLMPLMLLAMRAAYANKFYADKPQDKTLKEYLIDINDKVYYNAISNKNPIFNYKFNNVKYRIVSNKDTILEMWADAHSMVSGDASKSTTKDRDNNNLPNNSVNKLGSMIHYYLNKLINTEDNNSNVSDLFFVRNSNLIRNIFHDLEVSTKKDHKTIKLFTGGELFYHSIFNKFWRNYLDTGNIIIQPTVYSDKTTFINYEINTRFVGNKKDDLLKQDNYLDIILNQYIETIGQTYKNIWESTKEKLIGITDLYKADHVEFAELNFKLIMLKMSPDTLKLYSKKYQAVLNYNEKERNNLIKENPKADYTDKTYLEIQNILGLEVLENIVRKTSGNLELDKDYRKIKIDEKTVTTYNEELEYFATVLYTNKNTLNKFLENLKTIFVSNLLASNSYFLVLDYRDSYDTYLKEKLPEQIISKNTIIDTILSQYKKLDRINYFEKWVDSKTGRLILAKLDGKNIMESGDGLNANASVELNPILNKFFYFEGFMSNNIRLSLTGSEINHPDKSKKTLYDLVKSSTNVDQIEKLLKNTKTFGVDFNELLGIVNNTNNVLDLHDIIYENNNLSNPIKNALLYIYEYTLLLKTNVSLGTLFKRNVIIPATLQHCQLGNINGISSKTKCAVIYDEPAEVWNYRGDHEKPIDSADGSAWINPFQSILENKSLGSLAVGFIKKPIWHSYDVQNGTAFLAKFATDTITNEVMNASINSHTNMLRMFKKMTNLQWEGDVDLMTTIQSGKISTLKDAERWFNTVILGNSAYFDNEGKLTYTDGNKLAYKDLYGDIINIEGFGKTKTQSGDLYYTLERPNSLLIDSTPVYHIFYDDNVDGKIETSKHITFNTYQKAIKFMESHPGAHTINSLYELHTALGGINCVNSEGNNSEFVNEVVVNFMNSVGSLRPGHDKNDLIDLESYEQPLKKYHIGYALNNTAVKEGAKNVNNKEAWYDDSDLDYFEVDSDGLGMQMNADHDIIDSELTEFSQVITATSAYGYTQEYTNEIFLGLAYTALEASKDVIDAVNNFLGTLENSEAAKSDLYDAIGRIIFVNRSIKDKENLLGIIMLAVNKIFYKRGNHTNDEYKIPFSDANIYSDFISTLASTITKQSIKRKHPGSGCVMAPGFNIIQYFEVDGYKLNSLEVLKEARNDYKNELIELLKTSKAYDSKTNSVAIENNINYLNTITIKIAEDLVKKLKLYDLVSYKNDLTDVTSINHFFINNYLNKKQGEVKVIEDKSWYMPSDIVDIIDNEGNVHTYDLDSMDKYYKFKDGIYDAEINYNVLINTDYLKGKFKIALNEDPASMFVIERERDAKNKLTGKYNIHFKTGGFDTKTQRRTIGKLTKELKARLFNAALDILPKHSKLRLSPSTVEEIKSGLGGLTKGSYAGYTSIITDDTRHVNTEIILVGELYPVTYTDKNGVQWTKDVSEYEKISTKTYGHKYRVNIVKPHNLRPALIRWLYKELNSNGNSAEETTDNIKYMNIFDTKPIRDAFTNPELKSDTYRKDILETLNHLNDDGYFLNENNEKIYIVEGSLENTQAELVMSNLHKDKFNIGNESLNEILKKGRDYFIPDSFNKLNAPNNAVYDIAFLKDSGYHTLISLGSVDTNEYVLDNPFKLSLLVTNKDDEIYFVKNNRQLFKVGKWIDTNLVIYDGTYFVDSKTGVALDDLDNYKLKDAEDFNSVLKRIDYVKRYTLIDQYTSKGKVYFKNNTLYKIADLADFEEALNNKKDALNQRRKIVNDIYQTDSYKLAYINSNKIYRPSKFEHIKKSLSWITENYNTPLNVKNIINALLEDFEVNVDAKKKALSKEDWDKLGKIESNNTKRYKELLNKFIESEADKKWASFLDSLLYISSRIPAQTLQSFMSMKLVGWTGNSKNMAYVSHFQTYLQGSDYDIDKAYIMSLSYNSNGVYIGWSNLFDYSTYNTLLASKKLPIPKGRHILFDTNEGAELDNDITKLLTVLDNTDEDSRVKKLKYLEKILKKAEANNFKIKTINPSEDFNKVLNILNNHELYKIPADVAEAAYKNVASANIYAVADNIKNRDQAYTAISMGILLDAAKKSPKGNLAMELNMLNPLAKYIMQYLNLIGKNVISIAANGEKIWFNAFYYWTLVLKHGSKEDIERLKFSLTLNRIKGRAKYVEDIKKGELEPNKIIPLTVTHLPDLNIYDDEIKSKLLEEFDADETSLQYKEVDQLISQLLSAATDNAKELILAKINAGTNFAKMYIYAMITGFNIDDIVAFMTSPVAEFIDQMAAQNIFQEDSTNNFAVSAVNLALGRVNTNMLKGLIKISYPDPDNPGGTKEYKSKKTTYLLKCFDSKLDDDLLASIKDTLKLDQNKNFESLEQAMLGLILYLVESRDDILIPELFGEFDEFDINNYLNYCLSIVRKLKLVRYDSQYKSFDDFRSDSEEFKKLYNLSNEISTISSAWLGLNQGLPTDELSLLQRLVKMSKIVSDRESALGINVSDIYEESYRKRYKKITSQEVINNRVKLLNTLKDNNSTLNDDDILERLDAAYEAKIINNFDIIKYLKDNDYRKKVIDYYGLIMGTLNVFDMMEKIPHYNAILDCLKSQVVANNSLSFKSRLINKLLNVETSSSIKDEQLKGVIRYVNAKSIYDYFQTLKSIPMDYTIEGFDPYFRNINTNSIDLNSLNGISTLKHWVENEFLNKLRDDAKNPNSKLYNNGFIKHLKIIYSDDTEASLATDIDLLNPNITISSRLAYDEILRGISDLAKIPYSDNEYAPKYTIADIFQLYNLAVYQNQYGSERLTTVFKVINDPNSQLNLYLKYIGDIDYNEGDIDYNYLDYLINSAPIINEYSERFHTEEYVKVKDPIEGYKLKKYNSRTNEYQDDRRTLSLINEESYEDKLKRLQNFAENCPLELIYTHKSKFKSNILKFDKPFNDMTETELFNLKNDLINLLKDYSLSSKILLFKIC